MKDDHLRYPIGKFVVPMLITPSIINEWIRTIKEFPKDMNAAVSSLSNAQLDTRYREGGWTIRQVVHHCADSHMNAICRFKLALTEEKPTIKPYQEQFWAELEDGKRLPIAPSLSLLQGLHHRWAVLLESLSAEDLKRSYIHPEHGRQFPLEEVIGMYAWHCSHHLVHITTTWPAAPEP